MPMDLVAPDRFDPYLDSVSASELNRMVRLWGVKGNQRKAQCIATICDGLASPEAVRAALRRLSPAEHAALALLKGLGNGMAPQALGLALRAAGIHLLPGAGADFQTPDSMLHHLVHRGLLLTSGSYDPTYIHERYHDAEVFSDGRLLAHVGTAERYPIDLAPVSKPPTVLAGPCCFYGSIQRQEGRLIGNAGNHRYYPPNLLRSFTQIFNFLSRIVYYTVHFTHFTTGFLGCGLTFLSGFICFYRKICG